MTITVTYRLGKDDSMSLELIHNIQNIRLLSIMDNDMTITHTMTIGYSPNKDLSRGIYKIQCTF